MVLYWITLALVVEPLVGESPPVGVEVNHWVSVLGSGDFESRERAENKLRDIGASALPSLDKLSNERSERGIRARRVGRQIRTDRFHDFARNAAEGDVSAARRLPMWGRFRVPGLSDEERAAQLGRMMVVVAKSQVGLDVNTSPDLTTTERKAAEVSQVFRRLSDLKFPYRQRDQRIHGAMAALLYGGHPDAVLFPEDGMRLRLLLVTADATSVRDSIRRKATLWLLQHYVANLPNEGKVFALPSVLQFKLPETAPMCRVVLEYGRTPRELAQAAAALSASGNADDVELLRPLFDRSDLIRAGSGSYNKKLGQVALLSAIILTDQSPAEYGYKNVKLIESIGFNFADVIPPKLSSFAKARNRWDQWEEHRARDAFELPENAIHGQRL